MLMKQTNQRGRDSIFYYNLRLRRLSRRRRRPRHWTIRYSADRNERESRL